MSLTSLLSLDKLGRTNQLSHAIPKLKKKILIPPPPSFASTVQMHDTVDLEIFVLGNFRMINFRVENFS